MLRYRMGWRKCDQCDGIYTPDQRRCPNSIHRKGSGHITAEDLERVDAATRPLEDDERKELALQALGSGLAGVIGSQAASPEAADAIMDAALERLGAAQDLIEQGRQEVLQDPEIFNLQRVAE